MSRQSLAVNKSGAETGTTPEADFLAVDLQRHLSGPAGFALDVGSLDLDLGLAGAKLLLGADVRALKLEQVVLVGEHAVLHVQAQAAGEAAQRIEHAVGVRRDLARPSSRRSACCRAPARRTPACRVMAPGKVHSV